MSQGSIVTIISESTSSNEATLQNKPKAASVPSRNKLSIEDFDLEKELGRGSFGKVVLAKSKRTQKTYALKVIDKFFMEKLNKTNEALAEKELLSSMNHQSIVKLFSAFQSSSKLFYVLEYCSNGNFQDYLEKNGPLPLKLAQFYAAEIVNVLSYFEEKKIAHRDIKPGNIVLDENSHLKFIDFGTATVIGKRYSMKERKFVQAESLRKELVGTPEYASPEMLNHCVENEKSCDLWALGCFLYRLFHEHTPFKAFNEKETLEQITSGYYSVRDDIPFEARDLIQRLLMLNPNSRIGMSSIQEIKSHPFFSGINFEELPNTPVPKISKSKSVFCLNQHFEEDDEEDQEIYAEDSSSYNDNSFYSNGRVSENTILSSTSTVYSSPRNSQ